MRHAHFICGVLSQTKNYQVVRKEGTPLTFTTNEAVAVRL